MVTGSAPPQETDAAAMATPKRNARLPGRCFPDRSNSSFLEDPIHRVTHRADADQRHLRQRGLGVEDRGYKPLLHACLQKGGLRNDAAGQGERKVTLFWGVVKRVFLLSPASTGGKRARLLFSRRATFPLAQQVREPEGEALGEIFTFLSGLYFRGKLTYARAFAPSSSAIRVITCDRGLVSPDVRVTLTDLRTMARGEIDPARPRYRIPLQRDARALAADLGRRTEVVLLGSIATGKYTDILHEIFGERLVYPELFVGRGDMSRGGLMLRAVREGQELVYRSFSTTLARC